MKKDPTSIDYFEGMKWHKAEKWLKGSCHLLALGKSKEGLEVARAVEGSGEEAGTAVLAAFLAMKKNGLEAFVGESVEVYKGIAEEILGLKGAEKGLRSRAETLLHRVRSLEYYTSFVSRPARGGEFVWPLEMPAEMWADLGRRSGMANVMMAISIRELGESPTTHFIAAAQMSEFLREGYEGRAA